MKNTFSPLRIGWATGVLLVLWAGFFAADCLYDLMPLLSGRGFAVLDGQYYRLFSGALLHGTVLHLLINALTLFWIGHFLEQPLGSGTFLLFGTGATVLSQIVYLAIFPHIDSVFGGSITLFAFIGLILATQLLQKDFPRFRWGTWYGNWIVGFGILGNLPFFSFMNLFTVALHGVSFAVGFGIGAVACLLGGLPARS